MRSVDVLIQVLLPLMVLTIVGCLVYLAIFLRRSERRRARLVEERREAVPAFPTHQDYFGGTGMDLRDYFAAKAMQSITSTLVKGIRPTDIDRLADDAYLIADAMLRARERR